MSRKKIYLLASLVLTLALSLASFSSTRASDSVSVVDSLGVATPDVQFLTSASGGGSLLSFQIMGPEFTLTRPTVLTEIGGFLNNFDDSQPLTVQIRPSTNGVPDASNIIASFVLSHDNDPGKYSYESVSINLLLEPGTYFALFAPQGDEFGALLKTAKYPFVYQAGSINMGVLDPTTGNTFPTTQQYGAVRILGIPTVSPTLYAEINYEWVDGWYWPFGDYVTLTIMEPDNPVPVYGPITKQVGMHDWDDATYVRFDLWEEGFNVEPGHLIILKDEQTEMKKTLIVQNIGITQVNVTDNTITGYAKRDTDLVISAHDPCWKNVEVIANGDDYEVGYAYWLADFEGICDLSTAEFFSAEQQGLEESTGTSFLVGWPTLDVDIYFDTVSSWGWIPGANVTMTIDGPDIHGTENFSQTQIAGANPDDLPDSAYFNFRGDFYVQPGHTVILSDGGMSIAYKVESIGVTKVDPENKMIEGYADTGYDEVRVIFGDPWIEKEVDIDADGKWTASFEELETGSWGMARIPPEYGNTTSYSWVSPKPTTYYINPWWSEETVLTMDDVNFYVQWSACTKGLIESYQNAAHIDITINGEPLFPTGEDAQYWSPPEPTELDGCIASDGKNASTSYWSFPFDSLKPGIYNVHFHYWLDRQVTYGTDWDGDGKIDKFEGTIVENTVTIVVK